MSDANRARGFKSTLSNPNTSDEAKQHAREELQNLGYDYDEPATNKSQSQRQTRFDSDKNEGNVAGGYKAALKNPNVSQDAKQRAEDALEEVGSNTHKSRHAEKNEGNVIGGYKATLKNPNVSEEAKEHAQEVLEEHGVDVY